MTVGIPDPSDLEDAYSRGVVRERINAANVALAWVKDARALSALHSLGDKYVDYAFQDLIGDLTGQRDGLQEVLDIAMRFDAAPRRPTAEMMERIT